IRGVATPFEQKPDSTSDRRRLRFRHLIHKLTRCVLVVLGLSIKLADRSGQIGFILGIVVQPLALVLAEGVPQVIGLLAELAADLPQPRFLGDQREDRIGWPLLRIVASVGLLAAESKGIAIVGVHGCASRSSSATTSAIIA